MREMMNSLSSNPFRVLQVTTRDNSRKIVDAAEERSLFVEHDTCQRARSDLTNPRTRLAAEMAWLPGVAPREADRLLAMLDQNPRFAREQHGLPDLARVNLMAAAFTLVEYDESDESAAEFIQDFAWAVDDIDANQVLRDINEDRAIADFPEVRSVDAVQDELIDRRKAYCLVIRNYLDRMDPNRLVAIMTDAVSEATDYGDSHGPAILEDLVDTYQIETQGFLDKEYENLAALVESARAAAPIGSDAVAPILDKIELVSRNWDRVAQPIQVSAKSRGTIHRQSTEVAFALRSLGVDLNNDYDMLDQADRMTELLREIFAELPEVAERLEEDAEALAGLRRQAEEQLQVEADWGLSITFRAEVGLIFKDELAISPEGIRWKGRCFPLSSITRVRWGGVKRSINGIPSGTEYTIAFGDDRSEEIVQLRKEAIYSGFLGALWPAVCVRLIMDMLRELSAGQSFSFGDITVEDESVTLVKRKLFGSNQRVRLTWHEVRVWSADGNFLIAHKEDNKTQGSASYIHTANTHILEHIIRGGFKKGVRKLSDYARA